MAISEFGLLLRLGHYYIPEISDKVIISLKKLKDENLLISGDDSGLKNVWEEICAQVQGEYSYHWGDYEDLVKENIKVIYSKYDKSIKNVVNYVSVDDYSEIEDYDTIPDEYGINGIYSAIFSKADDYSNNRNRHYVDSSYED